MHVFAGQALMPQTPDVVQVALHVLQLYAMTGMERSECTDEEESMIAQAAECARDYIAQIGRFAPPSQLQAACVQPAPPASALQSFSVTSQQIAAALDELSRRRGQ